MTRCNIFDGACELAVTPMLPSMLQGYGCWRGLHGGARRAAEHGRRRETAEQRIRLAKAACNALASSLHDGAAGWRSKIAIVPEDGYNGLVLLIDTLAGAAELLRRFDFDGIADEALWKLYVEVQVGVLRSHAHLSAYLRQLNRRGAHPPIVLPHEDDDLDAAVVSAVDLLRRTRRPPCIRADRL